MECFVAKRDCRAKLNSAESICFLAAPCANEVQHRVNALIAAAEDVGLRCLVAERNQEFNRDVFCEKICRPIMESRFCVVLLDRSRQRKGETPSFNPNVFYEYGLMSALGKTVLAFTPKDQDIPFNVRHLDLISYAKRELRAVARRKFEKAISETQGLYARHKAKRRRRAVRTSTPQLVRSVRRVLEMDGYRPAVPGDIVGNSCENTSFEPHVGNSGILLLSYVGEGGVTALDARKDAVLLGRRLGIAWERARSTINVAKSKGWKVNEARKDMQWLERSKIAVVCSLRGGDLAAARSQIGDTVDARFGRIPIEVLGEPDVARSEVEVGLRQHTT